jgi:hypothetical protein
VVDSESLRVFVLVPLGLGLVGCLFLVIGIVHFRREHAFARGAIGAQGVVIGFQRRRNTNRTVGGNESHYLDFPVVRNTTRQGQEVQFESPIGTSPRLQREGQQVPVLYSPENPTDARLASGCMRYGLPLGLIVVGLGMVLFATVFGLFAWFLLRQIPAA